MSTRQEMKDKCHVILKKLEDNCLLENVSSERVKMRDAMRDMNNHIKKISTSFFTNMHRLSVLNFPSTKIKILPNSISELKNLTTLLLRGCYELKDLPCLLMLQELKKLDLCGAKIEEVPKGMDMLIKLS
ncbi:hypothetical protein Golax_025773 [Gossypium laxum]|uniref:Disease resistance protein n=1 Tax=Gossypium laxum TaxID=34288 RepID=A0A7J9B2G4_9ROSI|nr:hypothetical protein [Gossypium laxum]